MASALRHPPTLALKTAAGLRHAARAAAMLALGAALLAGGQPHAALAAPTTLSPLPLLVFAGQSNMTGWITNVADLTPAQQQTQAGVLFYGPNEIGHTWGNLTPPTVLTNGLAISNTYNVGFGPEISTGQYLTGLPGFGLVAEVKHAEVGTDLAYWWNPNTANASYDRMLARVALAQAALQTEHPDKTVYVAGFFWMQGEADALLGSTALAYEANLTAFITAVRADFGDPDLPFVFGQITGAHHEAGLVRAAQAYVAAHVANVALVGTDDLPRELAEGLHFTSAGIYTLGERFGEAFARLAILTNKVYLPQATR